MKYFTLVLSCLFFTCCGDDLDQPPETEQSSGAILVGDVSNLNIYLSDCGEEQPGPVPTPTWCDYYDDGSKCCTWETDGTYREWCQTLEEWCWEINGTWEED